MAETFYGPWSIELDSGVALIQVQLVISGSDGCDGRYSLHSGQSLSLSVNGASWTAAIESWFPDSGFTPQETRRTTTFEWADGLVATVECGRPPASGPVWGGPLYMYVKLRCVSRDPEVNPEPVPAPYDFTVPER